MVTVKEFVRLLFIEDGKPISELCSGDDLWVAKNKWVNKSRIIDWKQDHYQETVIDPQTCEVVHRCDEKLSDHQGHGSAKKRV